LSDGCGFWWGTIYKAWTTHEPERQRIDSSKITNEVEDILCKNVKSNNAQMERRGSYRWGRSKECGW
jgi:hypothetical protein